MPEIPEVKIDGKRNNEIPPVKLDDRRAFRGDPQLADAEAELLYRIEQTGPLQLVFTPAGPWYLCDGRRVDRRTARRLIERHYVLPDSPGLFIDQGLAQTWRARPADFVELAERLRSRLDREPPA